jgi:glutaredoxin-like protein NrdH
MVMLYTKPGCQPCKLTKQELEKVGVDYEVLDVTTDPAAKAAVEALNYLGVPVVVVDEATHWQGFRPDRIKALKG